MVQIGGYKSKSMDDYASDWGFSNRKGQEASNGMRQSQQQQSDEQQGIYQKMNQADQQYGKAYNGAASVYKTTRDNSINSYLGQSKVIQDDADTMAKDARQTYDTQILNRQKGIMEDAGREAGGAMTLQQAGDVNNSVQQSVRGLYDQQAQGVRQQGMADAGVLGALGAQNMSGQMGGAPMTGGQMQAMMGANMGQSAQAFARAQQYAQNLKEQGINRGFDESARQYDRGQQAKDRYTGSINDYERSYGNKQQYQKDARSEKRGYISDRFGVQQGQAQDNFGIAQTQAGIQHGTSMNAQTRELQHTNDFYGNEQGWYGAQAQAANADQAKKLGIYTGAITGGATALGAVAGGMMGGPQGAQAGAQVGGAAGQQASAPIAAASAPATTYNSQGQQSGGGYAQGNPYKYGNGYGGAPQGNYVQQYQG